MAKKEEFGISPFATSAKLAGFVAFMEEANRRFFEERAPGLPRDVIEGSPRDYNRATVEASVAHFKARIRQ